MIRRILTSALVLVAALMLLTACGASMPKAAETPKSSENDGTFHIVTSFYPMYVFTLNIAGGVEGVTVENMTEPQTGCLHDYELSPADMKTLDRADVLVINGAGMESFLDEVSKAYPDLPVIEASSGMALLTDESGEKNPHVWVGISGAITEVGNIGKALAEADPSHARQFKANMDTYLMTLELQKNKMHKALEGISHRDIITFHEAFPYFAQEFDLNILSVIEREPGTEPTANELEETVEIIRNQKVKAVFAEPQYSSKAADTIAAETGVSIYTLDPFVTGPKDAAADSYIKTMDQNLNTLIEALQ